MDGKEVGFTVRNLLMALDHDIVMVIRRRPRLRKARRIDLVVAQCLAFVVSACGNEGPVNRSIAATVEKGPGTRLVLAEHTGFPWDKVCILGPYTPDDRVDSLLPRLRMGGTKEISARKWLGSVTRENKQTSRSGCHRRTAGETSDRNSGVTPPRSTAASTADCTPPQPSQLAARGRLFSGDLFAWAPPSIAARFPFSSI